MLLSVVVPVYNVEKYLDECLQSILENQCEELEIVLVDDGSTDESKDICNFYSQNYPNVKSIHKQNGGIVTARKTGAQVAQGKYITFVDGDDWVDKSLYSNIINKLKQNAVDVYVYAITRVYEDGKVEIWENVIDNKVYTGIEIGNIIIPSMLCDETLHMKMMQSVCTKVMLKSLFLDNMHEVEDSIRDDEDLLFSLACLRKASSVWIDNEETGYYYRYVNDSMSVGYNQNYWGYMEQCYKNIDKLERLSGNICSKENYEYEKMYLLLRGLEKEFNDNNQKHLKEKAEIIKNVMIKNSIVDRALKYNRIFKLQVAIEKKIKLLLLKSRMINLLCLYFHMKKFFKKK